jgi:hypothetical protein
MSTVVRIEDLRKSADELASRVDSWGETMADATRKEKYLALKAPGTALVPSPAKPVAKAPVKDTKVALVSSMVTELGKLREKIQAAREAAAKASLADKQVMASGGKKDAKGAVARNGQAFYNGVVVKPGGYYSPRARFSNHMIFECKNIEWLGDRLIAVGSVHYLNARQSGDVVTNKFYYVTDLKESTGILGPGGAKFKSEGLF